MRTILTLLALVSASCAFDFSRSDLLRPGEVHGTAVGADGGGVAHVRATVEGLLAPARADATGGFRVVLGAGVFVVRVLEDKDGDGRAERGALRGVSIRLADIDGERRLTGVELGNVVLLGTGSLRGVVEDEAGAPIDAEVVVLRTTEGLGDGGDFVISADAARTLPAEARVRARVEGAQAGFAAAGLVPGAVFVVAIAGDVDGAVLVSAPQRVDVPSEGDADTGTLIVRPPPAPTVDVTLEIVSAIAGLEGELLDVVLSSATGTANAGTAPLNGAQLLGGIPVGRHDVLATSTLRPDELAGALDGQLALSLDDPTNPNAAVGWGPLIVVEGALCGALVDRDGDGLPALAAPADDLAAWVECAPGCTEAFGTAGAAATCTVGAAAFDCDDDGDLQPDVTEPFDCVSLCSSTDLDGDAACDDVDDDAQCALESLGLVCIGDADYVRPGVRPEYRGAGEGEGEGEGEPCLIDADCAPVLDVIALCDGAVGTCASTGVPVPSAPATTFVHSAAGWGSAPSPPARRDHGLTSVVSAVAGTFDVYLFGGLGAAGHTSDLFGWDVDTTTWTAIDAGAGPSPRGRAAFAHDAARDVIVLVGGERLAVDNGSNVVTTLEDVWELDLATTTWIERGPLVGAEPGSALVGDVDSKLFTSLVYARPSGAPLLRTDGLGGFISVLENGPRPAFNGDVVAALVDGDPHFFSGARASEAGTLIISHHTFASVTNLDGVWSEGNAGVLFPAARSGAAIAGSPAGLHVFGGDLLADGAPLDGVSARSNELWRHEASAWTLDVAAGELPGDLPPPRSAAAMAFDGVHVVIVGGDEAVDGDAAAALRLIETVGVPTWARVPALPVEPQRREAAFAFDSLRDEIVIVGGRNAADAFLDDAWVFSRQTFTWTEIAGVSPRGAAAAAYDVARDVIVLFGGESAGDVLLGDLQELDPVARVWTERVDVAGLPGPRKRHGMGYSPNLAQTFIIGGNDGVTVLGEVFRYDGTVAFAGQALPPREAPATTFSFNAGSGAGGLALYGGRDAAGAVLGDFCENDETTDSWVCLPMAGIDQGPRDEPGLTYDHITGQVVLFGGRDAIGDDRNDLWQIGDFTQPATPLAATFVSPAGRKGPVFVSDEQGLFLLGSTP